MRKHFWESAKFVSALGMIAKGGALAYGEITGNAIDADEIGQIVEQVAGLAFTAATSVATLLSIYQGAKVAFGRIRAFFTPAPPPPPPEPLPWLTENQPQPNRKDSL